jgi:hypothetical protein
VSIATRKLQITGKKDLDYRIDGQKNGVFLLTANKEQLTKGKKHVIILVSQVRPTDRHVAVKINPEIVKAASVDGTRWLDRDEVGEIILNITPRVDLDLSSLEYIVKLLVEGMS